MSLKNFEWWPGDMVGDLDTENEHCRHMCEETIVGRFFKADYMDDLNRYNELIYMARDPKLEDNDIFTRKANLFLSFLVTIGKLDNYGTKED